MTRFIVTALAIVAALTGAAFAHPHDDALASLQAQSATLFVNPLKRCTVQPRFLTFNEDNADLQVTIDVGQCRGLCQTGSRCRAVEFAEKQVQMSDGSVKLVSIVTACSCDEHCDVARTSRSIVVPENECRGKCTDQNSNPPSTCSAGLEDDFANPSAGEVGTPSAALMAATWFNGCSAGQTNQFDLFADNVCFGHTFTGCIRQQPCPVASATLRVCLQAAQVFLTWTDSFILGVGGTTKYGIGMPAFNNWANGQNTWNVGEKLCVELDLGNLPVSGYNIIPDMQAAGELFVAVQDDTAVDFVELKVAYANCLVCEPSSYNVNMLITGTGTSEFLSVEKCDCRNKGGDCQVIPEWRTFFPGTKYEHTAQTNRCGGICGKFERCVPASSKWGQLDGPFGPMKIETITECKCRSFWQQDVEHHDVPTHGPTGMPTYPPPPR